LKDTKNDCAAVSIKRVLLILFVEVVNLQSPFLPSGGISQVDLLGVGKMDRNLKSEYKNFLWGDDKMRSSNKRLLMFVCKVDGYFTKRRELR
jgi:hypothetical protein